MNIHYVYTYSDGGHIVYVGFGTKNRAWSARYGENDKLQDWINKQWARGHLATDYVDIVARGLSEQQARKLEREMIYHHLPEYNTNYGETHFRAKITEDQAREIYMARKDGKTYSVLAEKYGLDYSTVRAIGTGKNWRFATEKLDV